MRPFPLNDVSHNKYSNNPPLFLVVTSRLRARKETLLEDTRVATLIESDNAQLLVGILLDYAEGIVVCVE